MDTQSVFLLCHVSQRELVETRIPFFLRITRELISEKYFGLFIQTGPERGWRFG